MPLSGSLILLLVLDGRKFQHPDVPAVFKGKLHHHDASFCLPHWVLWWDLSTCHTGAVRHWFQVEDVDSKGWEESRGNGCLHSCVSCMGRLSLRDCKASFLTLPSALVPWDFLRLSWKPSTPAEASGPTGLAVGSRDNGWSGNCPFWHRASWLDLSGLPPSLKMLLFTSILTPAKRERKSMLDCIWKSFSHFQTHGYI